jgi:CheY-like chemotaxis protein
MPRLLLVDDNPSIHRIAESLLAPTDVELVCAASAAEALDRIGRGDRFDVALVDTAMPGMDGWTLLDRLRGMEETVQMPIALMAGVLDPVDPVRLAKASIQGFLKKPIELRELGDRVKALLATPVVVSPSAFSTVPGTPAKDLLKHAEEALPELRPEPAEVSTGLQDMDLARSVPEDDLLLLTAEDLWPEESLSATPEPVLAAPAPPDLHLELEELDLDHLNELETVPTDFVEPFSSPVPEPAVEPEGVLVDLPEVATLLGVEGAGAAEPCAPATPEPQPPMEPEARVTGPAAEEAAAGVAAPVVPVSAGPVPVSSEQAQALLQALLAEPVLMDVLVKALVERLGDQVLREIAWEVMPDLAGRLQR